MAKRKSIQIDFGVDDNSVEGKLYERLNKFTRPQVIIKEILLGNLPLDVLNRKMEEKNDEKN